MIDINGLVDGLLSHALSTGVFEQSFVHEPKNAPGEGLTCAIWMDEIGPALGASGLDNTSALMVFTIRLYTPMLQRPADGIDPTMADAVDVLLTEYSGDFDLGQRVRNVDLLGHFGTPLSARAGYLDIDRAKYRVMDITLPLVINDVWAQSA